MPNDYSDIVEEQIRERDAIDNGEQPKPANPYADAVKDVVDQRKSEREVLLKSSAKIGVQTPPDRTATALAYSAKLQMPVDVVERNLEQITKDVRINEMDQARILKFHPELAGWLSDPRNASIGQDDMPALRDLDESLRALNGEDPRGILPKGYRYEMGKIVQPLPGGLANTYDTLQDLSEHLTRNGEIEAARDIERDQYAQDYQKRFGAFGNIVAGAGQSLQSSQRALGTRTQYDHAGDAEIQASVDISPGMWGDIQRGIGGLIADVPLMLSGGAAVEAVVSLSRLGQARNVVQSLGRATAKGQGAEGSAKLAGQRAAAQKKLTAATQAAPLTGRAAGFAKAAGASQPLAIREGITEGQDHSAVDGALAWLVESAVPGSFGRTGVERALLPSATDAVADGWRGAVGRMLTDAGLEASEESLTELAHAIREKATGADPTALDPDKLWRRLIVAGTVGGAAGGSFSLPAGIAEKFARDHEEGRRALVDAERLTRAVDILAQSKTNERSPERVRELMETTLGQGSRFRFIDADQFREAFQDPAAAAAELGLGEEYTRALATGGQLQIPTSTLLQSAAKDAQYKALIDISQREPTAKSAKEAQEFQATQGDALKRLSNEARAAAADATQNTDALTKEVADIESDLYRRLDSVAPETVDRGALKRSAKIVSSAIGSLAKRSGKSPAEFFKLRLRGDMARVMRGEKFDLFDAMIERLRSGDLPSERDASQSEQGRELLASMQTLRDAMSEAGVDISASNKDIRKALADLEERQGAQGYGQQAAVIDAPKSGRLDFDAMLRQWRKATGDRSPVSGMDSWQQLVEESAKVDAGQGKEYNQPGKEDRRASIKFDRSKGIGREFTITLTKSADVSSFLHESGHLFLELFADLAADPNAPADIKADWQRILDWLGAKDIGSVTEDQHETFARGFERYLFEGKAPASNLREAFARIKAWMVAIYKSVKSLRVELTPEIRDVFDRLIAAEDSTDQAEAANGMDALLPRDAFPTLEEWQQYSESAQESRQATRDRLEGELLEEYNARKRAEIAAQRAEVHAAVSQEVDAMPVYQAIAALQRGQMPDGTTLPDEYQGAKIDRADLVNGWGESVLSRLPGPTNISDNKANRGAVMYANENGLPVDQVAKSWGFASGDAMIAEMIQADDRASLIESLTDKRMKELRPDPMTDGTLTDRANAALATDQRAELFRRELNALGRRTGQAPAPIEVLRQVARDQIAGTKVYQLAPDKFRVAAAKAARRAIEAAAKQDWDGAYRAKTQEALNLELYRAARDAKEAGDSGRAYLRTFDTLAKRERIGKAAGGVWAVFNADGEEVGTYASQDEARSAWEDQPQGSTYRQTNGYLERIDDVLDGFQLRRASNYQLRRTEQFRKWIAKNQEEGDQLDIDPRVIEDLGHRNWNDLAVEEQTSVVDAVRNIEKQASLKNRLLKSSRDRDLAKARVDIISTITQHQPKIRPDGQFDDILSKAMGKAVGFFESHRKDSFLARRMDGDQDGGAVWDYLIRARNEAAGEQETRSAEESSKLSALFTEWGKKAGALHQDIPGTKLRLTTEQRISLALNWGNKEGRQRVMSWLKRGGWTGQDAQAVLDSLDAADWKLVNGVVATINARWSDVAALERATKGIEPEKVQALPFVTKAGVQPGGYYPIKYDPKKSTKGGDLQAQIEARDMLRGAAAQTRKGHTKIRSMEVDDLALRFDFGVIGEHLSEVIHDITHREMLLDQNRLLRDKEISQAILSRYGRGALDQFTQTATDIAKGDAPARTAAERFLKAMRINNSAATFGFNATSALMNLTGVMQSMTRVGPLYMAQATARLFQSRDGLNNGFRFADAKSDFMRNRSRTMLREVADATRAIQPGGGLNKMQQIGYYPMMQVQRVVDTVTWLGAYEQALAKAEKDGKTGPEADALAVSQADQAVIDTQGSGRIGDLSAFQRGGEGSKLLTAFYSYFNVAANLQGSAIRRVYQNPANAAAWGRLVTDTLMVWTLPALFGSLIKSALQGDDREDDKWLKSLAREQLSYGMGMLVGLREASGLVEGHFGYSGPAGTRGLAALAKGVGEVFDGDLGKGDAKALSSLAGVFTGIPAVQINRLIDAIMEDAANGKEGEALRLALFGAPRQ